MHTKKTFLLLALVGALTALIVFRGGTAPRANLVPLVADLDLGAVRGLRIENLQRGTTLLLERDERGAWYLTDPIAYPADSSTVQALLDVVSSNTCYLVTDRSPKQVGLDPPRALLEVVQARDGEERRSIVGLGAPDLGGGDVYVSIDDRVYLTLRSLEGVLELPVHQYRDKRVLSISERAVASVERAGWLPMRSGSGARDLELSALRTADGWQLQRPYTARLDDQAMAVLVRTATQLRATDFVDDDPERRLHLYGLDDPHFVLRLGDGSGGTQTLQLATEPREGGGLGPWRAMRAGHPHVFEVEDGGVVALGVSLENLLDYRLTSIESSEVVELGWTDERGTLELRREDGVWRVDPRGDEEHLRPDGRADARKVQETLAEILTTEIEEFLPGYSFAEAGEERRVFLRTADGKAFSGVFGGRYDREGKSGRLFRVTGDELPALVPEALFATTDANADAFWDASIHKLDRLLQVRIELRRGDRERTFVRDRDNGLWYDELNDEVSIETGAILDDLQTIQALGWVGAAQAEELADPVSIRIFPVAGAPADFTLGRAPGPGRFEASALPGEGHAECESAVGRAEVAAGKLVGAWKLFGG